MVKLREMWRSSQTKLKGIRIVVIANCLSHLPSSASRIQIFNILCNKSFPQGLLKLCYTHTYNWVSVTTQNTQCSVCGIDIIRHSHHPFLNTILSKFLAMIFHIKDKSIKKTSLKSLISNVAQTLGLNSSSST